MDFITFLWAHVDLVLMILGAGGFGAALATWLMQIRTATERNGEYLREIRDSLGGVPVNFCDSIRADIQLYGRYLEEIRDAVAKQPPTETET
jgi:hypothetical protein